MGRKPQPKKRALRWGDGFINERALKDGTVRYQARWSEEDPAKGLVWRSQTFHSLDEAEKHLREIGESKRSGDYTPESRLTLLEAVNEYAVRSAQHGRWKPNTVGTNRVLINRMIAPRIGAERVTRLRHRQLQLWVDGLLAGGLSASSTASSLSLVKSALTELARLGVISSNPATGVTVGKRSRGREETWTIEEVRQLLATAASDPKSHALYLLALTTGMRPGELRALMWPDIDRDKSLIRCRRTITRDVDHKQVIGDTTKTGRARVIAVSADVMAALVRWHTCQLEIQRTTRGWHDEGIVFDRGDGRFMPDATFQSHHRRLVAQAGITPLSPHAMRHTAATHMLEQNIHPKIVSEILGHASIAMTLDRYSHVSTDLQKAAAESISQRLLPVTSDATTLRTNEDEKE